MSTNSWMYTFSFTPQSLWRKPVHPHEALMSRDYSGSSTPRGGRLPQQQVGVVVEETLVVHGDVGTGPDANAGREAVGDRGRVNEALARAKEVDARPGVGRVVCGGPVAEARGIHLG